MTLLKHIEDAGFPFIESIIHVFVGGSELHGAKVGATDDLDIYGVYIESPDRALGLDARPEHFVWSTAGGERRNGPDDVDITLYSLHKWAGLAAKGNPTSLHFLFAEDLGFRKRIWQHIASKRELFLSRQASYQFKGFADAQLRRLQGDGNGKHGQRPEYIGKFGYDTKAAMHIIRLLHEGIELMTTGMITLPRPEKECLIKIRTGEFGSLEKVLDMSNRLFAALDTATNASYLPEHVNRKLVSSLVTDTYLQFWGY